jgi:WD40 repeat protein
MACMSGTGSQAYFAASLAFDDVAERLAVSSDGRFAATGHVGGITRMWDLATGELCFEDQIEAPGFGRLSFSTDDRLLISSTGEERDVRVYDVQTGRTLQDFPGYRFSWLTPDDQLLLYRLNELHRFGPRAGERLMTYRGHRSTVQSVAFGGTGKSIRQRRPRPAVMCLGPERADTCSHHPRP